MANAPRSLVNETVGQFQIKEELGRGGMAVVYKGYQPSLDRWVAIKTLPAESSADRELVARFHREAEAMVQLNHSNIVQIIDKGQDKGLYYFAMEFVEGPSLKDLLKQETLSMELMFDVAMQVCDGLGYAHKKGIVHRDVKPANILYEKATGLAKVADFGIARKSDDLTLTTAGMGTMNYMAPEQREDARSVDHRADIYSLGVMVYEMFTGKLPLGRFKPASQLNPSLPRKLDEVISRALETDPADRYQQMDELKADLQLAREASKGGTLVRSVRDAAERTLTAFAGEGGGGKGRLVACCLLFAVLGLGGGGAFVVVDPMKMDLLAKVGLKKGGTTTEVTPTTESKPPVSTTDTRPTTTDTKPPTTPTESRPPTTTTESKPPVTATESKPPTTTESKPPVTTTESKPPVTNTESQPPTTTESKPPVSSTESKPPQPEVKRLSDAQLARYNTLATELERELQAYEPAATRVGLAALGESLQAARTAGERATKLKDEGAPEAVSTVEGARDELRQAARRAFTALIEELRSRVRREGGDPAELQRIDEDYGRLSARSHVEQARGWGEVVDRLHGVRVSRLEPDVRLALEVAALRADAQALEPLRRQLAEAAGLEQAARAVALEKLLARVVSLQGPTPTGLRQLAHRFVAQITGDGDNGFYFYSICPAPGQRVAALGPLGGQKVLFVIEPSGESFNVVARAPLPLTNPSAIAPAGGDAFWVAEAGKSRIHRYLVVDRARVVEEATIDVGNSKVMDLDTAPDGTLWVATLRDVRAYRDGLPTGAGNIVERDFVDYAFLPRRVAALVGGGWILTGHVPVDGGREPRDLWGDPEVKDEWALTLRAQFPGDTALRQYQPRDRNILAVAPCGGGFLALQHRNQGGGDIYHMTSALDPNPTPLRVRGHRPELAQDVAVSGRVVYVLEKGVAKPVPQFRRRLVAYEIE